MIDRFLGEYFFLSNFHYVKVKWEGLVYPSVEHAYQASKTMDRNVRVKVREAPTPGIAKKMGRRVVLRDDWEEVKLEIMRELLLKKFGVLALRSRLLGTVGEGLVEGNNWGDRYWGVCDGKGENNLGKLLMEVRDFYDMKK